MSRSLYIDCQRLDEPAASDPLERGTWAEFRLFAEDVCITEFWNRHTRDTARTLYMPLFELADWIVRNWWALLHEPCQGELPPGGRALSRQEWEWLQRHCLRTADSSLFLPFVSVYSNGPQVSVVWSPDEGQAPPGAPGRFVCGGATHFERREVEDVLREFVAKILRWTADIEDDRVAQLRDDFKAITEVDLEERLFCEAAGKMGLDPFCVESWPSGVEELFTCTLRERLEERIVNDFLESATPSEAPVAWTWVDKTRQHHGLSSGQSAFQFNGGCAITAKDSGYELAQELRRAAGLTGDAPIEDISQFVQDVAEFSLEHRDENHAPSRNVNAVIGWANEKTAIIAGPRRSREDNNRFFLARGLYQSLVGCTVGARLLTRASTWDQQASRAFAAELLAPQAALAVEASSDMESDERVELQEKLAEKYCVSTEVIRLQLHNQGVWRAP